MPEESAIPKRGAPKPPSPEYLWQKSRLKPDNERLPGASLIAGYGPEGKHSLYLPSAKAERRFIFKDGSPQVDIVGSCLGIPEIMEARNAVLRAQAGDAMRLIFADAAIARYSALLLRTQYNLSDEDLTFLHSGKSWIEPLARHAVGGDEAIESLRKINPHRIAEAPRAIVDDVAQAVAAGELVDDPAFYGHRDDADWRDRVGLSSD